METESDVFFADTYALIESLGGNKNYTKYKNSIFLTTKYNLAELYYSFLREFDRETAQKCLKLCTSFIVELSDSCLEPAMNFKFEYKKEKLSYIDCIGYVLAAELGVKFLTGDEKFENKPNVEFVK